MGKAKVLATETGIKLSNCCSAIPKFAITHPTLAVVWEWHARNCDLSNGRVVRQNAPTRQRNDCNCAFTRWSVVSWDGWIVEGIPDEAVDPVIVATLSGAACIGSNKHAAYPNTSCG